MDEAGARDFHRVDAYENEEDRREFMQHAARRGSVVHGREHYRRGSVMLSRYEQFIQRERSQGGDLETGGD